MEDKLCPKCNWRNKPTSSMCVNCSAPLEGAPAPAQAGYGSEFRERPQASSVKTGPNIGIILLVLLLLGGAAFGGWWFFLKPKGPEVVVQRMLDAAKEGDYDKLKSCMIQSDIRTMEMIPGGEAAARKAMKASAGSVKGGKIIKTTYDEKSGISALVEVQPDDPSSLPAGLKTMEIVVVQENREWKIDMRSTTVRMIRKVSSGFGMLGQ